MSNFGPCLFGRPIELRRARPGDERELQRFYHSLSHASRRTFRPLGWSATSDQCKDVVDGNRADPEERFDLFAVEGERIVGWGFVAGLTGEVPGFGIGIADHRQGQGLARRLMGEVVEEVRRREKAGISLCLVQDNVRALRLYESFGFRETGTHRGEDGLDYFDMRLDIPSSEGDDQKDP